jgi:hypothetical protein
LQRNYNTGTNIRYRMFSRRVAILLEFVFWLPHESDHIVPNTMKQNFIDGVVPLRPFVSLLLLLLLWRSVDTVSGRGIDFRFLRDDCITSHHITSHHITRLDLESERMQFILFESEDIRVGTVLVLVRVLVRVFFIC